MEVAGPFRRLSRSTAVSASAAGLFAAATGLVFVALSRRGAQRTVAQAAAKASLAERKKAFAKRLVSKARNSYQEKVDPNYIAPYSPTPNDLITKVLDQLKLGAPDVVYDLGCGDARWLFAANARFGCQCVGIGIDKDLVAGATAEAKKLGVQDAVKIELGDIYAQDLAAASVVVVYAFSKSLERLKVQFLKQLRPSTTVLSVGFQIKGWTQTGSVRVSETHKQLVYMYEVGAQ